MATAQASKKAFIALHPEDWLFAEHIQNRMPRTTRILHRPGSGRAETLRPPLAGEVF
jgi:hypothetical protein